MKVKEFAEILQDALIRNDHRTATTKWGIASASGIWLGAHYSRHNRRLCVGLLFIAIWVAFPGGYVPQNATATEKTMNDLSKAIDKEQQRRGNPTVMIVDIKNDPVKNAMHRDMTSESPIDQRFPRLN